SAIQVRDRGSLERARCDSANREHEYTRLFRTGCEDFSEALGGRRSDAPLRPRDWTSRAGTQENRRGAESGERIYLEGAWLTMSGDQTWSRRELLRACGLAMPVLADFEMQGQ